MGQNHFRVNVVRKHLYCPNSLFIQGCFLNGEPENNEIKIFLDEKEVPFKADRQDGYFVKQKYGGVSSGITTELSLWVTLPETGSYSTLKVVNVENKEEQVAIELGAIKIKNILNKIDYHIDEIKKDGSDYVISGWVMYGHSLSIECKDGKDRPLTGELELRTRPDVMAAYPERKETDVKLGFSYRVKKLSDHKVKLIITADGQSFEDVLGVNRRDYSPVTLAKKIVSYTRRNGVKQCVVHACRKGRDLLIGNHKDVNYAYKDWIKRYDVTEAELSRQRKKHFSHDVKFSIVIPLYNTPLNFLKELLSSIQNQTYTNWEICFADGSTDDRLVKFFDKLTAEDSRIKYKKLSKNDGISGNTNEALKMAEGDYIVLADHDDLLAPNALYEFAAALEKDSGIEVLYSDEDKIDMEGKERFEPHFKPDFNIDLLCSVNYICHLFAVKKTVVDVIGNFRKEYDGAQDYDFIFRCVEQAKKVYHVPKILYHWRSHMNSTAENPESKLYAFEAGRRAIEAHFQRIGMEATVENGVAYGIYHAKLAIVGKPLVSVIIPNKDHIEDLDKCLTSVFEKTEYTNYEIIIVENNSTEEETFAYYERMEQMHDNLKVVTWKDEFNYSAINNFGAKYAKGEYLLLLNNDIEVIQGTWMEEMLGYCQREDVGIVGARLYYPDDTIQHAGVVIGFGGVAGHTFIGQGRYEFGYFARAMCTQDYSAVTAACLMTKKSLFEQVGGLTEAFKVAFNDIDYCMKIRSIDKLVVYNPYAELYHYESKSRGLEDTKEKIERFNSEIERFQKKWDRILVEGDPFYNPNLALDRSDFALRK